MFSFQKFVSTAPQPSVVALEDITFDVIDDILDKIEALIKQIKCGRELIKNAIAENEGEIKQILQEFSQIVENYLKNELKKCNEVSNILDKLK